MPDKSPRKPNAKKAPGRSMMEKRHDKKEKRDAKAGGTTIGGLSPRS